MSLKNKSPLPTPVPKEAKSSSSSSAKMQDSSDDESSYDKHNSSVNKAVLSGISTPDNKTFFKTENAHDFYSASITAATPITAATATAANIYHSTAMKGIKADPDKFTGSSYATPRGQTTTPKVKKEKHALVIVPKEEAEPISSDDESVNALSKDMAASKLLTVLEKMQYAGWRAILYSSRKDQGNIKFALRSMNEKKAPNIQKLINKYPNDLLLMQFGGNVPFALHNITVADDELTAKKKWDEDYLVKNGMMPKDFLNVPVFSISPAILRFSTPDKPIHLIDTLCIPMNVFDMLFPMRKDVDLMDHILSKPALKSGKRYFWNAQMEPNGPLVPMASFDAFSFGAAAMYDYEASAGSIGKKTTVDNDAPMNIMVQINLAISNFLKGARSSMIELEFKGRGLLTQPPSAVIPDSVSAELKELRVQKAYAETRAQKLEERLVKVTTENLHMYQSFVEIASLPVTSTVTLKQVKEEIANKVLPKVPIAAHAFNQKK